MASDSERRNFFSPSLTSFQKSYLQRGAGGKILALQFQYIVTLANCNKASIKKSSLIHQQEIKYEQFGGRPLYGGRPGAWAPWALH